MKVTTCNSNCKFASFETTIWQRATLRQYDHQPDYQLQPRGSSNAVYFLLILQQQEKTATSYIGYSLAYQSNQKNGNA
jgi:hypothetical protein